MFDLLTGITAALKDPQGTSLLALLVLVNLLYWYKSTNTDAAHPHVAASCGALRCKTQLLYQQSKHCSATAKEVYSRANVKKKKRSFCTGEHALPYHSATSRASAQQSKCTPSKYFRIERASKPYQQSKHCCTTAEQGYSRASVHRANTFLPHSSRAQTHSLYTAEP